MNEIPPPDEALQQPSETEKDATGAPKSGGGLGAVVLGPLVLAACCGAPFLIALGGGAFSTVAGIAARYWPLTGLGLAASVWGAVRLARLIRAHRRALSRAP